MNLIIERAMQEKEILDVIEEIERENRERRLWPDYALDIEVRARFSGRDGEVRAMLRRLYREGKIKAGQTLNHIWIRRTKDAKKQREHATDEA